MQLKGSECGKVKSCVQGKVQDGGPGQNNTKTVVKFKNWTIKLRPIDQRVTQKKAPDQINQIN